MKSAQKEYERYYIRALIINQLRRAAAAMPNIGKREFSWENLLLRINQLDDCLKKTDVKYKQTREDDRMTKTMLLCTATDDETRVVIQKAKEYGFSVNRNKLEGMQMFHLGIMGHLDIFLTQTEMGTERMGSARDKIRDLAKIMNPDYILSTGICYGLRPRGRKKYDGNRIGDIIVANQMQMYESQKVSEIDGRLSFIPRGDKVPVSIELLDAFRAAKQLYSHEGVEISFGLLLSGNLLVNSKMLVEKLKQIFPEAINGDMEAGGIYSACHESGSKWIAVKCISDWGFDKTDKHQEFARNNLYDFLFFVLSEGFVN